jgi:hypothetical protein
MACGHGCRGLSARRVLRSLGGSCDEHPLRCDVPRAHGGARPSQLLTENDVGAADDGGVREPKGIPGEWRSYAVERAT